MTIDKQTLLTSFEQFDTWFFTSEHARVLEEKQRDKARFNNNQPIQAGSKQPVCFRPKNFDINGFLSTKAFFNDWLLITSLSHVDTGDSDFDKNLWCQKLQDKAFRQQLKKQSDLYLMSSDIQKQLFIMMSARGHLDVVQDLLNIFDIDTAGMIEAFKCALNDGYTDVAIYLFESNLALQQALASDTKSLDWLDDAVSRCHARIVPVLFGPQSPVRHFIHVNPGALLCDTMSSHQSSHKSWDHSEMLQALLHVYAEADIHIPDEMLKRLQSDQIPADIKAVFAQTYKKRSSPRLSN